MSGALAGFAAFWATYLIAQDSGMEWLTSLALAIAVQMVVAVIVNAIAEDY